MRGYKDSTCWIWYESSKTVAVHKEQSYKETDWHRFSLIQYTWSLSSPKCDYLHWTPMNRRAKFDAASFIPSGVTARTRTHNYKKVNDISTSCLSSCVDNEEIIDTAEKKWTNVSWVYYRQRVWRSCHSDNIPGYWIAGFRVATVEVSSLND